MEDIRGKTLKKYIQREKRRKGNLFKEVKKKKERKIIT